MSNTRARDEGCAYTQSLRESLGPAGYVLGVPRTANSQFVTDPRASSQGRLASVCEDVPLVDVDSELIGITRKLSACAADHYNPNTARVCNLRHLPIAEPPSALDSEDCRMSNPACTLRGTGWNRWEWLPCDPQQQATRPFETLVNYRTIVKDNHRPLLERPMSDACALPPGSGCGITCGAVVSSDLETVLRSLPERPTTVHWRSAEEIRRIRGECRT
jgi:hypothetical protein